MPSEARASTTNKFHSSTHRSSRMLHDVLTVLLQSFACWSEMKSVLASSSSSSINYQYYDLSSMNNIAWNLQNCDGKINIPATLPGLIHTDLLSAGILKENPYYRFNELEQSWVSKESCWKYSTTFSLEKIDSTLPLFLEISGLDTIASITINDNQIGSTSNAFKTYSFEVPNQLLSDVMNLSIQIDSPVSYAHNKAGQYPYSVPHTENYNVWTEPSDRNFIRKAGSDFGWDWGPAYVPSGLTGSISLFQSSFGKFDNFLVLQDLADDYSTVTLNPKLQVQSIFAASSADISLYLDGKLIQQAKYDLHIGQRIVELNSFVINNPSLWYPIGFGDPHLYELTVKYCSSTDTSSCQSQTKKIGIRKVELIREKIANMDYTEANTTSISKEYQARSLKVDSSMEVGLDADDLRLYQVDPQTFYFKVNGAPIFARGANFIPIDSFQSRVTHADRYSRYLLSLIGVVGNIFFAQQWPQI